ncbi:hypothetical protein FRB99_000476 [Tulasnella sp. 403]|nr:hypothetical protein FRB99_000476 [Tulasnella sp. 403]
MADRSFPSDDPFEKFLRAPVGETAVEKTARLAAEEQATRANDEIEDALREAGAAARKRRDHEVKVLLLGQEGSGKTTTLKQFLLNFSDQVFSSDRAAWRIIVFLNVIHSFKLILQGLSKEFDGTTADPEMLLNLSVDDNAASLAEIRMRLLPVVHMEANLIRKLDLISNPDDTEDGLVGIWPSRKDEDEPAVKGHSWKNAFQRHQHSTSPATAGDGIDWDDREDPGIIFHACRSEMMALWSNPQIAVILKKHKIDLEDSGFFLDSLDRITARRYVPTDDDVLRARLRTVGAAEHSFAMHSRPGKGTEWKIYDVGGSRTQRQTWAPFFDDVDVILFLAPISAFDQVLAEDRQVNRLEDSITLWADLCRNRILAKVPLVLFLNKCDRLKAKLESGVSLRNWVPSYGSERANDFATASAYFYSKFEYIKKSHSPPSREVFIHLTTMTVRHRYPAPATRSEWSRLTLESE